MMYLILLGIGCWFIFKGLTGMQAEENKRHTYDVKIEKTEKE